MLPTKYNNKVNTDGTYRPFHGYTVVADLVEDLSSIEETISKSPLLNKYFSPLPSSSYHMTTFNIWSRGQQEPPVYANINKVVAEKITNVLMATEIRHQKHDREAGDDKEAYYNKYPGRERPPPSLPFKRDRVSALERPEAFWFPIMNNIDEICQRDIPSDSKAVVKVRNHCNGVGLGVSLELDNVTSDLFTKTRIKISKEVGHDDSKLMSHMTLAYRYRDIPPEDLELVGVEIRKLNEHILKITSNGITFKGPRACWFRDMKEFIKSEDIFF